jgi:2-dehydro-3-deoxyphosphogluconate aldolase/(4S)-4-hydroxy-2-oxoglutarate aldolase
MNVSTMTLSLPRFKSRVVPVIVITDPQQSVPLAHALLEGGIDVMEITLRHRAGLPAIEAVAKHVPEMFVGAGTVTQPEEVAQVNDAGASFALSPGMTDALIDAARRAQMPFVPGVMTPGEVMRAREHGFDLLKLFPAAQAGGLGMLKALAGPLGDMKFCPTGGVSLTNMREFLSQPNVVMVGGSWLTPVELLESGQWTRITEMAREASALAANHA